MTTTDATTALPRRAHVGPMRTPLWDNARFGAITLVIVGHATLELISQSDPAYSVYLFVYLFHVPVFVAISGHFAKAAPITVSEIQKLVRTLVVPYLVFETIWSGIHWAISGSLTLDYATAWWTLWFLVSLFLWRVMLPFLVAMRFPLTISVIISVAAGYVGGLDDHFGLARTFGLLPFFVLGWKIKQADLTQKWLSLSPAAIVRIRVAALGLFALTAIVVTLGISTWRELLIRRFLLYDEQYGSFGYDQWWAGAIRLLFMGIAVALCFAFLVLVPRRPTPLTAIGQATLYIYLLHSFVLYPIRQWSWFQDNTASWVLVGVIAFSVVLPFVLGSRTVTRVLRPLVEPRLEWLFRRSEPRVPSGNAHDAAALEAPSLSAIR